MGKITLTKFDIAVIFGIMAFVLFFSLVVSSSLAALRERLPLFQSLLAVKFDQSCSPIGQVQASPQLNCATFGAYRVWFTGEGRSLEILFGAVKDNGTTSVDGKLLGSAYMERELTLGALQLTSRFEEAKFLKAIAP